MIMQQQSQENQSQLTSNQILATVLGEKSGYVRGKGYGAKATRKRSISQIDVDTSLSSALENIRQQVQVEFDKKLQEELEKIQEEREKMQEEREKMQEECDGMKIFFEENKKMVEQMEQRMQSQIAALMASIQQGQLPIVVANASGTARSGNIDN